MDHQTWPDPIDSEGWLAAAASGLLAACPPGAIVLAVRAQIRIGHHRAADALAAHLRAEITRRLRRKIGLNHPGRGDPMIERARDELLRGSFDPQHGDYEGLAVAFEMRVEYRALDAIKRERRLNARHPSYHGMAGGFAAIEAKRRDGDAGSTAIEHALARIADPRKRLAFRLYVEGAQIRAGNNNIADAVGVDPKTAKAWIEEAKSILKANMTTEIGA